MDESLMSNPYNNSGGAETTEANKVYSLPKLPYDYDALKPYISEEQLKLHYQKHHQAYVNGANAVLEKLDKARKDNTDLDMKAVLKEAFIPFRRLPPAQPFLGESGPGRAGEAEALRKANWQKPSMKKTEHLTGLKKNSARLH